MSKRRLLVAVTASLTGSLLLGSATPSVAPPGQTIALASWSDRGHSSENHGFQIRTSTTGKLYPGTTRRISLTVSNPNPFPITVRTIKGRVAWTSRPGCRPLPTNLEVRPYAGRLPLLVRAFSRRDAGQLEIYMPNSVIDACQRARFVIHIDSDAARADR
jgi:uncharacterized protein YwbE